MGPEELQSAQCVRTDRWKYIHTEGEIPQLYDMRDDPLETRNLAGDSSHEPVCRPLKARVMEGWEIPTLSADLTAIESRYLEKAKWLERRAASGSLT